MWSSEVMLLINSSVSSGVSEGPSTRWRMPWTRMTGGTPTRMCRSEAPSETTSCRRSDIEYDIIWCSVKVLVDVSDGGADDFLGGGQAGQDLADAVLAQGAHAHFARAVAEDRGGNA